MDLATGQSLMILGRFWWSWGKRKDQKNEDSQRVGKSLFKSDSRDFPGGTVDKNPAAKTGDMCWIPDPGRLHMPQSN